MYFVIHVPFSLSFVCVFLCSHWSLVDVPLIFFCPADHVPDWQPRVLLGMVEARSVNVKKTTTTTTLFFTLTDQASTIPSNIRGRNPIRGLLDRKISISNESMNMHTLDVVYGMRLGCEECD